jgi:hypothetical protein
MSLGKSEAGFSGRTLNETSRLLEKLEPVDVPTKGIGRDLIAPKMTALDAGTINGLKVGGVSTEGREDFFDGFEQGFGVDFSYRVFIGTMRCLDHAVVPVPVPPGLDGAPGKLVVVAVFVFEAHRGDGFVTGSHGVSCGILKGAEDPHFQISRDAFHRGGLSSGKTRDDTAVSCCGVLVS